MTTEPNERTVITKMIKQGNDFESALGRILLNADNWKYMASEAGKAFVSYADDENTEKLITLMGELRWISEANEHDRRQRVKDLWPEIWADFAERTKVTV